MVHVTNRANVHVGLVAFKLGLGHSRLLFGLAGARPGSQGSRGGRPPRYAGQAYFFWISCEMFSGTGS